MYVCILVHINFMYFDNMQVVLSILLLFVVFHVVAVPFYFCFHAEEWEWLEIELIFAYFHFHQSFHFYSSQLPLLLTVMSIAPAASFLITFCCFSRLLWFISGSNTHTTFIKFWLGLCWCGFAIWYKTWVCQRLCYAPWLCLIMMIAQQISWNFKNIVAYHYTSF